jgi:hypothetical protein
MLDKPQRFDSRGGPETYLIGPLFESESAFGPTTGIHPAVFKVALSAVAWFLAVAWLNFAGGIEVDWVLSVMTGFFVMFLTLFLVAASMKTALDRRNLELAIAKSAKPREQSSLYPRFEQVAARLGCGMRGVLKTMENQKC